MVQIEFTDRVIPSDVVQFEPNEYATKENILDTKKCLTHRNYVYWKNNFPLYQVIEFLAKRALWLSENLNWMKFSSCSGKFQLQMWLSMFAVCLSCKTKQFLLGLNCCSLSKQDCFGVNLPTNTNDHIYRMVKESNSNIWPNQTIVSDQSDLTILLCQPMNSLLLMKTTLPWYSSLQLLPSYIHYPWYFYHL